MRIACDVVVAGSVPGTTLAEVGCPAGAPSATAPYAPMTVNIRGGRRYPVSKRDGRAIIGATGKPGVYDRRPTLTDVDTLAPGEKRLAHISWPQRLLEISVP
ncbi:MAG: hypothetical protein AB1425_12980 [Actinomycetota bacterium]